LAANSLAVYGVVAIRNIIVSPFQWAYFGFGLSRKDKEVKAPFVNIVENDLREFPQS